MATVFINEFHYDNSGADSNEFIEIAGPAGTDLTGWSIVLYNGNGGASYNTINLSETISDQSNGFGTVAVDISGIQNGSPDGIALVDSNNTVVQFLSYEGSFTATNGPANGMTSTDIGVSQQPSPSVDSSLQLQGEGSEDSDFSWVAVDGSNTKGDINASQTFSDGDSEEDTTAPELSDSNPLTPADDTDNAVIDGNLTIKFNESVQKGTGNIVIKKTDDDSEVEIFNVATSPAITVSGDSVTINPTNNLEASTDFYVEIDAGAIQDTAGNNFAGISGNETWNFTTGTEDSITEIYEIQGAGHTSPFVSVDFENLPADTFSISGSEVTTTGIVTAVDTNGGRGFYLQDATGDGDNATSDAIFVFTGSTPTVNIGDELEVTGTVAEFFPGDTDTRNLPTTQISSPTITVKSSGNALPEATIIGTGGRVPPTENIDDDAFGSIANKGNFDPDTDGIDFFESLEGMLVTAKDAQAIAPTNRFGEIFTVVDNGENATGISERGTLNISPDDFNPEKVQIDEDSGILDFEFPDVNVGAKLGDVTGVVGYSFGNFEIIPTEDFTGNIVESTIEAETTTIQGTADRLTVASYNVLNLDPNDADGDKDVENGRFDAIAAQIVNNLKTPDIIGLQEIQDNTGSADDAVTAADQTLQQLVDAIKTNGGPEYQFIDNTFIGNNTSGGQPGGNIRTAFLYNPDRVGLVDGSVESIQDSDQQTNEDNPFNDARLPLVAKFTFKGEEVTVVNNHFSSKGGSSPILGVEQPFEARQEEVIVNGSLDERQAQAEAVKGYVDGILAADSNANVVVLGDLNEFEFVSPVKDVLGSNLTNLAEIPPEDERYSFIFQGNSQYLDHILVSDNLAGTAEFDILQVNSEFAETTQRASDHDPLIASLSFSKENMDKINLSQVGTFTSEDGAEIVAYDPTTQRLFVTTGDTVEVIDISNPAEPVKVDSATIDVTSVGDFEGGGANSVAVSNNIVAVAVEADTAQDNGIVAFYNTDGEFLNSVEVGALPDMLTFTPDGTKVIVANEGEPNDDYDVDPEGSISIIDISGGVADLSTANVTSAGFTEFNDEQQALIDAGVRIFGPNATVAQDLEPEYVAVSADSSTAFVTLQENNAVAVLDIDAGTVTDVLSLGEKDHSLEGNELDASNRDGGINIQNHPVFGLYQPDAIASFEANGETFYITANEGDARDYDGFIEEARVEDLTLDPALLAEDSTLQDEENLGRLKTTTTLGDLDGDGDVDKIYSYGGRSFSIWNEAGELVFDSGDQIAQITARETPTLFNANDGIAAEFDERSDDKGAEPESVTVGMVDGKPYGFIGLERAGGGVLVYDLSDPTEPEFTQYIRTEGDIAPEGLQFIAADESPNGKPMLAVANEESNTTTLYEIEAPNYKLQILHASDLEGGVEAIDSAANFAAIVEQFEDEIDNTIILSAGDNYIPGPFFGAAGNRSLRTPLQEFYQEYFEEDGLTNVREGSGRVDISIMNAIGFDASAVGNHEFDAGTNAFGDIIGTDIRGTELSDARWLGAQFPYLSANLDFSEDSNLSDLYTDEILSNTEFQADLNDLTATGDAPKIAPATVIEEGGEKIGVVGATTQIVETISSTGGVDVEDPEENNMAALAEILQPTINKLIEDGINKVVVVSHLQQIALEKELAGLLSGVDVIIAGGSDTLQADDTDVLRDGDVADEGYPFETTNADGDPTVIVSTAGEYSYVGRLVVEFDSEGKVIL
ncbi:MAG: choice-of-anchor I family protein, partial [Cyanobacteria bacterium J06621_15]